jgi:glucose/arabinose dehydrogenase
MKHLKSKFRSVRSPWSLRGKTWNVAELESRLLLAADVGVAVSSSPASNSEATSGSVAVASGNVTPSCVKQLVIVDSSIADDPTWSAAMPAGADIVILASDCDPVEQISNLLEKRRGLDAVHLFCHGSDGVLKLGDTQFTLQSLRERRSQVASWGKSFAEGGDLLVYGCNVAASAEGSRFVAELATCLGVDVAASVDRTGPSKLGGNWHLEWSIGHIQYAYAMNLHSLEDFNDYLAIEIYAAGSTGSELMELQIGNQVVSSWDLRGTNADAGQFLRYVFNQDGVSPNQIRINFVNDLYDPANGIDRNLRVDRIVVDGVTYQTEDPSVFASGVWVQGQGIVSGNRQTEFLSSNGFFQFASGASGGGSTIEVSLKGQTGQESAQLLIDGSVVQTFNSVSSAGRVFSYTANQVITADRVRVAFTNDLYNPSANIDRNLIVDFIRVDGRTFQTEAPTTFSTGTYVDGQGVSPGFKQSETLHSNGYFEYLASTPPEGEEAGSFSLVTSEITTVEGRGAITLEVRRVGGSSGAASIDYLTAADTAIAGQDFVAQSGRLLFGDGETSKTFTIGIINDGISEATETFSVRLDNPVGASLLAPRTSLITVLDDDSGLPRYSSFTSAAGLKLNGASSIVGNELQLTATTTRQAGTAFFQTPITVNSTTSFQSAFTFRIGGGSGTNGADGMAFIIQNSPAGLNALGRAGGYLGYDTIANSLAIEFDTYSNGGDSGGNNISVVTNGNTRNAIADVAAPFDLNSGAQYYAWVDYNGDSNTLAVYLSTTSTKPAFAVLKTQVQLDQLVGNRAYVGFSAGNYDIPNFHRVGSWNFSLDAPPSDPQVAPTGNIVERDIYRGLNQPIALNWSPDGRNIYIAEKGGVIKVGRDGSTNLSVLLDISAQVNNVQDRGLLDVALDPNFQSNGYIYLLYTYDPPQVFDNIGNANAGPDGRGNRAGRLMRVTADASTGFTTIVAGSETILLGKNSTWNNFNAFIDSTVDLNAPQAGFSATTGYLQDFINSDSRSHTVGSLAFGLDGNLFVSIGDGASFNQTDRRALRVQSLNSLSGKVLRINPLTGQGVSDNPFYDGDPNSNRSKIYQLGLRNPWRLTVDPNTGRLFIGETGLSSFEEINTGGPGANFGWPYYEGGQGFNSQTPGYNTLPEAQDFYRNGNATPAVIALQHQGGSDAVVLGDIVVNSDLGSQYEGDIFYNDLYRGIIRHANVDANGRLTGVQTFVTGADFVVDIQQGPDRSLYYANLVEGTVGKWVIV